MLVRKPQQTQNLFDRHNAPPISYQAQNTISSTSPLEHEITAPEYPGRTIRNETIPLQKDVGSATVTDDEGSKLHLRLVDYVFNERALPYLHTITKEYAHVPLPDAFNWDEVAERLGIDEEGDWFIVAFRSVRSVHANAKQLYDADARAHEEAKKSGGLLKYWYGDLNEHRECLAMCIWANHDFARLATRKPLHLEAVKLTRYMYDTYDLERYSLRKTAGVAKFDIVKL